MPSTSGKLSRHLRRLVRLLCLLRSGPLFNVPSLTEVFGVSRRTIQRDLRLLREAGVEINYDTVTRAFKMPVRPESLQIETDALMTLAWAANLSPLKHIPHFAASIRMATATLISSLPELTKNEVGRLIRSCTMLDEYEQRTDSCERQVLEKIFEAMRRGLKVRLSFRKNLHVFSQTKVSPYALQMSNNKILLTGRSSVHRGVYEFDLSDVVHVDILDEVHHVPPKLSRKWKCGTNEYQERSRRKIHAGVQRLVS